MGEREHSDLQTQMALLLNDRSTRMYYFARTELRVQTLPRHFRLPDVCVLRAGSPREKIVSTPPLLCVEVLSPDDTVGKLLVRVNEYLAMGVPQVWILNSETRTVRIHTESEIYETATGSIPVLGTPASVLVDNIFRILDED